ncbi:hypothetical protein JVT61DRAFT_14654 [Boletus reticuloceps]|uniref:Uncharacterized protein n=1 Tax=Boletus reticuloceps TaxID=495285 RepID=A0A8I3ACV1_9AGAM|nr:hypothetical protein JVT61DRAFT_14654 [Boletus reticuloceps]
MENEESRPKRTGALSARLRDQDNAATPELRSHQHAQHAASIPLPNNDPTHPPPDKSPLVPPSRSESLPTRKCKTGANNHGSIQDSAGDEEEPLPKDVRLHKGTKRLRQSNQTGSSARTSDAPTSTLPQDIVDADGLLEDVNVLGITEAPARENRTRDIDKFFMPVYSENNKKLRKCTKCSYVTLCLANKCMLMDF